MSSFSLRRRVTTFMIYVAVVLFGIMSFANLAIDLMPNIEIPVAIVSTTYSGAGSAEVESMVTEPLESVLALVSDVDDITSISSEGSSMIILTFTDDADLSSSITDMRDKIDLVTAYLPTDCSTPVVMEIDLDAMAIMQFSISGDTSIANLETIAEDKISPSIESLTGVASVTIEGGYENVVNIVTDSTKMRGYGLTIEYVSNILRATNLAIPSGQVTYGDKTLTVRTDSEFTDISDIKNVIIPLPTGGTVSLSEIATVTLEADDISTIAKVNGENVVMLSIQKQSGTNTAQVASRVNDQLDILKEELPEIEITMLSDTSDYIQLSINAVMQNILLAILFSVIVLFAFLRKIAPTVIIAISMPICIITTFLIMLGLDLTLNIMTLGGMAVGVGMIVDNSVVVLENIVRFKDDGYERMDACLLGAKEVALPITASTITTIAVFLPVGLSGGMVGMIFNEFSLTITALLVASLLIALTLVPLLCYLLLDRGKKSKLRAPKEKRITFAGKFYQFLLRGVLKIPALSLLVALGLFLAFLSSTMFVGAELIPSTDQSMITVTIELPISSDVTDTTRISDEVVSRMSTIEEGDFIYYSATDNTASVVLTTVAMSERNRTIFEIGDEVRDMLSDIAGAEISISDAGTMDMSSLTGSTVDIAVKGDDLDTLTAIANDLVAIVEAVPNTTEVSSTASDRVEQLSIKMKPEIATSYGFTAYSIGTYISYELQGVTATTLSVDGTEIDVVVKGDADSSSSIDALKNMLIQTPYGTYVPLNQIADVTLELGAHSINRINQTRTVSVTASTNSSDSYAVSNAVDIAVAEYELPDGYYIESGGEAESLVETFTSLAYALVVAVALIYFVLASQFESILLPFIVMLAMPLGLSGGIFGLFVTDTPVSMIAFIGIIMLSGIVVNNSIVLIDYIRIRQENGEDIKTAIFNACPLRVRPVFMTTLTTILGLVPMALGIGGEGSEMMIPMAIVMISGLSISTCVTLLFTPLFYYVIKRPRGKKKNSPPPSTPNATEKSQTIEQSPVSDVSSEEVLPIGN
ncbi:MAG: efflux RND transporter permease subunit [Clostridia bacterium]